jgi:CHAT domain-containing protein
MTEQSIRSEDLHLYRRIHFATHSLVDEGLPSRSAIVLGLSDTLEDGFLTVGAIADYEVDCELVVLSACQTGRGQILRGEGLVGLARSFLFAGARSVMVSLWSVSDVSTTQFMKILYRHLLAKTSGAESLRQAKLESIANGKAARHPYYWAPFVLIGP